MSSLKDQTLKYLFVWFVFIRFDLARFRTGLLDDERLNSFFRFCLNMRLIVGIGLDIHKVIYIKDFNKSWLIAC